jgi:regulator of ribonuclease activity B
MTWLFRKQSRTNSADLDAMVLAQLDKAGSDLQQPHEVDNFLYFADQPTAALAADRLRAFSKSVEVTEAAKGPSWCAKAVVVLIPTPGNVAEMRARMESVAAALKGEYDGWGAPIVPRH